MYVKLLAGRYAGEVRDLSNEAAMGLLANGRAGRAFVEENAASAPASAEAAPVQAIKPVKPAKSSKKANR
jgi:hypothetical protein